MDRIHHLFLQLGPPSSHLLVGRPGFEPRPPDLESGVLPGYTTAPLPPPHSTARTFKHCFTREEVKLIEFKNCTAARTPHGSGPWGLHRIRHFSLSPEQGFHCSFHTALAIWLSGLSSIFRICFLCAITLLLVELVYAIQSKP